MHVGVAGCVHCLMRVHGWNAHMQRATWDHALAKRACGLEPLLGGRCHPPERRWAKQRKPGPRCRAAPGLGVSYAENQSAANAVLLSCERCYAGLGHTDNAGAVCVCVCLQDPIFKGNKVPNEEMGYPGGIFDPLGFRYCTPPTARAAALTAV